MESIFNAWEQRPLFKTHVSKSTVLRRCNPLLKLESLRQIGVIFKTYDYKLQLDKTYEPTEAPKGHPNEKVFDILQECRSKGLVQLEGEDHMYYAAIHNKSCSLTALGQFYWHLIKANKI